MNLMTDLLINDDETTALGKYATILHNFNVKREFLSSPFSKFELFYNINNIFRYIFANLPDYWIICILIKRYIDIAD